MFFNENTVETHIAVMINAVTGIVRTTIRSSDGVRSIPKGRSDIASLLRFIHDDRNNKPSVIIVEKDTMTSTASIFPI